MGDSKHSVDSVSFHGWNDSNLILCIPHCMGQLVCYLQVHFRNLLQFEIELIQSCKYFYFFIQNNILPELQRCFFLFFPVESLWIYHPDLHPQMWLWLFSGKLLRLDWQFLLPNSVSHEFLPWQSTAWYVPKIFRRIYWKSILYKNLLPLCVY